ncbi:hypothetical protein SBOR_9057 [Sclerotinia borealis F-4128]|uniref:Uncharacterized protein n=1 Tax=Sclerotinia borealis (strain F-4128) TaxID=1432307 RepID=W9C7I8_SCLBF|nr:hypothetical protein SBOR_9057 [Sclerotinia borealis F-4128]
MGNKNARGSAASIRPSTAIFAEIAKQKELAADTDLTILPTHSAIKILGDNEILFISIQSVVLPMPPRLGLVSL